ncbi:AAA family ATPase [Mycoplasmopsis hyopharyngis]|uniref:AAA family ATPase n=1 Tax=Mycoplasmopsis hyopharyngis TaxID=29558 RepID=UPI0038730381
MSFIDSINKQLKIKLNAKNILIFKGNTQDFVFPKIFDIDFNEDLDSTIPEHSYQNFSEYLIMFLSSQKYKNILYYSPSFTNAEIEDGKIKIKDSEEEQDEFNNNPEISIGDFIGKISARLETHIKEPRSISNIKEAYIIDMSEFIFSEKNQETTFNQIARLIGLLTNFYNQSPLNFLDSKIKLIFITKNSELFSSIIFKNNEEVQYINVPKPSKDERKKFFQYMKPLIKRAIPDFTEDSEIFNQAISITDSLSFREILQYIKVLQKNNINQEDEKNKIKDFKSLSRLINFDKKESEWENIEYKSIAALEEKFKSRVLGQDEAISAIKNTLIRSFVGLQGVVQSGDLVNKPRGILFLAGPTGVGKTEIVKTFSEFIFGSESKIIRFDMSEYNHEESDQKLIGSAPGYVGYEAGGQLTNAVLEKPFSILLFDEIEKANGKILDKFLQILEDGRLTSSKGELVNFSETFIIFTSNIGADAKLDTKDKQAIREHYKKSVIDYFNIKLNRPEILNRIGIKNIVPFNPITKDDKAICESIITNKISKIIKVLKEKRYSIVAKDEKQNKNVSDFIISKFNSVLGGRGLVMLLETYFVDPLSNFIFENYLQIKKELDKDADSIINIKFALKEQDIENSKRIVFELVK